MQRCFHTVATVVLLLISASCALAQLPVMLTTQEALPFRVEGLGRHGEPVTIGLPLADNSGIANVNQLGISGASEGQFRCLSKWPSGNCKWILVDYQLSELGAGRKSTAVALTTGRGNFGGNNLANDSNPGNANSGTIAVSTGPCRFTIQKAKFDVLHAVECNGKNIVAPGSLGLALMGPPYNGERAATTCDFNSTCTALFSSSNDPASTCAIEENGPVRAAIKCSGALKDSSGNKYMGFLVRLHFYAAKPRVRLVATLKNADDGPAGSFPISYKGYQSFELRLATAMGGNTTWTIGTDGGHGRCSGHACSGQLGPRDAAYFYQAYSTENLDPGYHSALQFRSLALANAAVEITRANQGRNFSYAQDGSIIVGPNSELLMSSGSSATSKKPTGWADVKDSAGAGVTFGTDYIQGNFPRSLEIRNGGREIRIGISPDQALWTGRCGSPEPCRKIYYQPWPEYKIANLDLIFHDTDTNAYGETGVTRAENDFARMQYPLIARAPITYYNAAKVFVYPLVDPAQHDRYMNMIAAHHGKHLTSLADIEPVITRFYEWSAGGSSNQLEYRYSDLVHRWLERGFAGRYLNTIWFTRFQEQFAWERTDGISCVVRDQHYSGWACHRPTTDLSVYNASPSKCTFKLANACNDQGGMLPNNCEEGKGCRGGYVDPVADENSGSRHYHWWSAIYDYLMTGDEDVADMLKDGVVNEYTAIGAAGNYIADSGNGNIAETPQFNRSWQSSGTNNRLGQSGALGGRLGSAAHFWRFLADTGDTGNATFVDVLIHNLLSVMYREPCATTGTGSRNANYPVGCIPVFDGYSVGQETRGFSAYRGVFIGSNEANDAARCMAAPSQDITRGGYVRCIEPFMQGYLIDAIWTLMQLEGPGWPEYNKLFDLAYGAAINTDSMNYLTKLANAPLPSDSQLVYTMAFDQPNNLDWYNRATASDTYGTGPPFEPIYFVWGKYTGDEGPWRSHWENTIVNRLAGNTYDVNKVDEYGSQLTDEMASLVLNPPATQLVTLCSGSWKEPGCIRSFNAARREWTLTWAPPAGVAQYFLKEHDSKLIVDNIGWSNATNQPLDANVATHYNWFAATYTATQPSLGQRSITLTAPSTANFMLKARVIRAGQR